MSLQYPLSYFALSISSGWLWWITGHTRWWLVGAISIWIGISFALLGLIYLTNSAEALGKRRSGTRWIWALLLFWPYFLICELSFLLARKSGQIDLYAEIAPGVLLGRRLTEEEAERIVREKGIRGVVDLAAEYGETNAFRSTEYLSLPVLDAMPPRQDQLIDGMEWIDRVRKTGTVYLHCALGHGRAATTAAAYLVYSGVAKDAAHAIKLVRAARSGVKLNQGQRAVIATIPRPQ